MNLLLRRRAPIGDALPGELFTDGRHICYTLERIAVAIPAGTYKVGLHNSPRFGRLMPILEDVPGRQDILIHWGNYPQNSDGCILVGETVDASTGDIFNSRKQFDALFQAIEGAVNAEGCSLTVQEGIFSAVDEAAFGSE